MWVDNSHEHPTTCIKHQRDREWTPYDLSFDLDVVNMCIVFSVGVSDLVGHFFHFGLLSHNMFYRICTCALHSKYLDDARVLGAVVLR